ncbi:MAG: hypothetical protein AB1306_00760 [Nitrospirota bacterium]
MVEGIRNKEVFLQDEERPVASGENKKIYRYISLPQFLFLIEKEYLYLNRITAWPDPLDGYLLLNKIKDAHEKFRSAESVCEETISIFRTLDPKIAESKIKEYRLKNKLLFEKAISQFKQSNKNMLLKWMEEYSFDTAFIDKVAALNDEDPNNCFEFMHKHIAEFVFGTSWSLMPESDALWRIYSPQLEGVQIQTTEAKLRAIMKEVIDPVTHERYPAEIHSRIVNYNHTGVGTIVDNYFYKREAFSHEQEFRAIVFPLQTKGEKNKKFKISSEVLYAKIPDITNFIECVTIHPQAVKWLTDTLSKYCKKHNLIYRKSDLYSPKNKELEIFDAQKKALYEEGQKIASRIKRKKPTETAILDKDDKV